MKKKLLAGLAVGVMMLGVAGVVSATTQTFNFESSVPQGRQLPKVSPNRVAAQSI